MKSDNNLIKNSSKSKKKLIGIFALGGLILTGPFASFAVNLDIDDSNFQLNNSIQDFDIKNNNQSNGLDYDKQIRILEEKIKNKVSEANTLLELINESSVDINELNKIIYDFVKLETFLEEVKIEKQESNNFNNVSFDKENLVNNTNFTAQTLEMIDKDLAQNYAEGKLTLEEVKERVKDIMS